MELCRLSVTGSQSNSTRHALLLQSRFGNYTFHPPVGYPGIPTYTQGKISVEEDVKTLTRKYPTLLTYCIDLVIVRWPKSFQLRKILCRTGLLAH